MVDREQVLWDWRKKTEGKGTPSQSLSHCVWGLSLHWVRETLSDIFYESILFLYHWTLTFRWDPAIVALSGSLLEVQTLHPILYLLNQNLPFNEMLWWWAHTLKSEKHWSKEISLIIRDRAYSRMGLALTWVWRMALSITSSVTLNIFLCSGHWSRQDALASKKLTLLFKELIIMK